MPRRKHKHLTRNIGIAVAVIAIVLGASVAAFYFSGINAKKTQVPTANQPLAVGDTFTYKLSGSTVLGSSDAVTPKEFLQYNNTNYYQVNVTAIEGNQVSLETTWQFKNGTQITNPQVIDLSTGSSAQLAGFSYLYPSNLNVTDPLYPQETSKLAVNSTSSQQYAHSSRATNYWATEDEFVDTTDQSGNTARYDYISVYFDRQTGILDQLTRIQFFTNPEIQLTTTWQLVSSNVWAVQ
jgi:hypothetical protein